MTSGSRANLSAAFDATEHDDNLQLMNGDCTNPRDVREALIDVKVVFHLAANPEVRLDRSDSETCFQQNLFTTHVILEEMKHSEAEMIVFTSSSTVYGKARILPTREDYSPLEPVSLYGASKLASESLISAYCYTYGRMGIVLRLANVVGSRCRHGVIYDFVMKLLRNPRELEILGNGKQEKSYLHVEDCVSAISSICRHSRRRFEVFNIGSNDQIKVGKIAKIVATEMGINAPSVKFKEEFDGGGGWVGDVERMFLDTTKLRSSGWNQRYHSVQAVQSAARSLLAEMGLQRAALASDALSR